MREKKPLLLNHVKHPSTMPLWRKGKHIWSPSLWWSWWQTPMNWRNFESSGHRLKRKAKMQEILQESSKLLLVYSSNCLTEMWLWFTFKHHSKDTTKCPTSKNPDVSLPLSLKLCMQIIWVLLGTNFLFQFLFLQGREVFVLMLTK